MTGADIDIVLLADAEIPYANQFYNSIYKTSRDLAKFNWEFRESPAQTGICVVAKDRKTGKIVGSQSAIPIDLVTAKGEVILSAKSEDTLVHPDYRGLSIFENMYKLLFSECEKRGIKYIWGFTYAKKPFTKLGFDTPYIVSQSLIVFDIAISSSYLSRFNRSKTRWSNTKMKALSAFSRVASLKGTLASERSLKGISVSVVERTAMDDNNALVTDILSSSPDYFIIRQDLNYLRWRIVNNPYHDDIFNVCFYEDSRKVGQVVFNHHEQGVWYILLDLYSPVLSVDQKSAMLKKAVAVLKDSRKDKLALIRTWDFSHNDIGRLDVAVKARAGFTQVNHGAVFVWKKIGEGPQLKAEGFVLGRVASEGKI